MMISAATSSPSAAFTWASGMCGLSGALSRKTGSPPATITMLIRSKMVKGGEQNLAAAFPDGGLYREIDAEPPPRKRDDVPVRLHEAGKGVGEITVIAVIEPAGGPGGKKKLPVANIIELLAGISAHGIRRPD